MTKLALPLIFAFVLAGIVFMALLAPSKHSSCHLTKSSSSPEAPSRSAPAIHRGPSGSNDGKGETASEVTTVTDAAFEHDVLNSKEVVLVDFSATWCGPCRMMAPVVHKLDEQWNGKVKVLKMDVDENPASADRYGVRALPTFMVFKGGKPVERTVGMTSSENLQAMVQKYL